MAWNDIPTYVGFSEVDDIDDADEVSHEHFVDIKENLDETMPGKATGQGEIFYATGTNAIAAFDPNSGTTRKYLRAKNSSDDPPLEWVELDDIFLEASGLQGRNRFVTINNSGELSQTAFFRNNLRTMNVTRPSGYTYPLMQAGGLMYNVAQGDPVIQKKPDGTLVTISGDIAAGSPGDYLVSKGTGNLPVWEELD